jgi:acyl carrier protein
MNKLLKANARDTVIAVVDDLTQDWGLDRDAPLGSDMRLAADLEFASVDIIQLCVALEQCYGRRFGFQDLLMKDGSYVGDLSLGQFADFIETKLASERITT